MAYKNCLLIQFSRGTNHNLSYGLESRCQVDKQQQWFYHSSLLLYIYVFIASEKIISSARESRRWRPMTESDSAIRERLTTCESLNFVYGWPRSVPIPLGFLLVISIWRPSNLTCQSHFNENEAKEEKFSSCPTIARECTEKDVFIEKNKIHRQLWRHSAVRWLLCTPSPPIDGRFEKQQAVENDLSWNIIKLYCA